MLRTGQGRAGARPGHGIEPRGDGAGGGGVRLQAIACCMYSAPVGLQPRTSPVSVRESSTLGSALAAGAERAGGTSGKVKSTHIGHSSCCHTHSPVSCFFSTPPPTVVPTAAPPPVSASACSCAKSTPPQSASYTRWSISRWVLDRLATSSLAFFAMPSQQRRQTQLALECTQLAQRTIRWRAPPLAAAHGARRRRSRVENTPVNEQHFFSFFFLKSFRLCAFGFAVHMPIGASRGRGGQAADDVFRQESN